MKLTVKERILLGRLYPQKGSMSEQIILRDIQKKVDLTQKEVVKFEVKEDGNQIVWNEKKAKDVEIEFSQAELELLKSQVAEKDTAKEISGEILDVCIKIKNAEIKA